MIRIRNFLFILYTSVIFLEPFKESDCLNDPEVQSWNAK